VANTVTKTVLLEGSKNYILHVYLESDGVEGELNNYVLVDPYVEFSPAFPRNGQITIEKIWASLSFFDAHISFDALEKYNSWVLSRDTGHFHDFNSIGGLKDRSGAEHTGKLLITTKDFAPAGTKGSLILKIRKD
jgi:hypothetical protein